MGISTLRISGLYARLRRRCCRRAQVREISHQILLKRPLYRSLELSQRFARHFKLRLAQSLSHAYV